MAAHTLMILSRAAISRTTSTTPLKDNTQQFRTSSRSATKKRKIEELDECERNSRTSSKNLANSSMPMKKKKIKASLKVLILKPYLSHSFNAQISFFCQPTILVETVLSLD
jgi:hypothetical protein